VNPAGHLKLIGQLRDLQIVDRDGCKCGIVDDVELEGEPGKPLAVTAILVGPGAYAGRLPRWLLWAAQRVAGARVVRVRWSEVTGIGSTVQLRSPARELGLMKSEDAARRFVPRGGAI